MLLLLKNELALTTYLPAPKLIPFLGLCVKILVMLYLSGDGVLAILY